MKTKCIKRQPTTDRNVPTLILVNVDTRLAKLLKADLSITSGYKRGRVSRELVVTIGVR